MEEPDSTAISADVSGQAEQTGGLAWIRTPDEPITATLRVSEAPDRVWMSVKVFQQETAVMSLSEASDGMVMSAKVIDMAEIRKQKRRREEEAIARFLLAA